MYRIPLRKTYEVTGYVIRECVPLCPSCYEDFIKEQQTGLQPHNESEKPIFLGDEWDYQPVCDWCHEEIDVSIIDYSEESG